MLLEMQLEKDARASAASGRSLRMRQSYYAGSGSAKDIELAGVLDDEASVLGADQEIPEPLGVVVHDE
jgi:hypothetical protein